MKTYIALLRGINVGGHRKVPMADLRALLATLNFENVKTYIQSGNVIFETAISSNKKIETQIKEAIKAHFGFEITVLVKTHSELENIFNNSPFNIETKENSYFILLDGLPNEDGLKEVRDLRFENEEVHITNKCIYFFAKNGYGRTKFNSNFFERKLKVNATARNYKTMLKLLTMAIQY